MNRGLSLEFQQAIDKRSIFICYHLQLCACCLLCPNFTFYFCLCQPKRWETLYGFRRKSAVSHSFQPEGHCQKSWHRLVPLRGDEDFRRHWRHRLRDKIMRRYHCFQLFRTMTLCPQGYKHRPYGEHRS